MPIKQQVHYTAIHISHFIISGISIFIELNITIIKNNFSQPKQNSSLKPSVFSNQIYKKSIISFLQTNKKHRNRTTPPPPKIAYCIPIKGNLVEKVTTRFKYATWAMSKSQLIYMWENVDSIIQIIESLIDFNLKTTDLYDSQYWSKEDEDCSL